MHIDEKINRVNKLQKENIIKFIKKIGKKNQVIISFGIWTIKYKNDFISEFGNINYDGKVIDFEADKISNIICISNLPLNLLAVLDFVLKENMISFNCLKILNIKGYLNVSSDFKNQYDLSSEDLLSLEKFFSNKSTLNLINDNDVVINTFSSAAIDAYLLKKYLIIPKYFFSTYTQYQKYPLKKYNNGFLI